MRMTRAALRAQEAEEDMEQKTDATIEEQSPSKDSQECLIHEDSDKENSPAGNAAVGADDNEVLADRPALRDITEENYPMSSISEAEVAAEQDQSETVVEQLEKGNKSQKKAKGKKGKKGSKKKDAKVEDQVIEEQLEAQSEETKIEEENSGAPKTTSKGVTVFDDSQEVSTSASEPEILQEVIVEEVKTLPIAQDENVMDSAPHNIESETSSLSGPNVSSSSEQETPARLQAAPSKTPKFNPDVHVSMDDLVGGLENTEDSFVESIRTRSPSKLSQSLFDQQNQSLSSSFVEHTNARTPSRSPSHVSSTSPQRIEDSVEAIDALEDAIEKFAEDLPVIGNLQFESPLRSRKAPIRTPIKTPAKTPTKTPAKMSAKLSTRAVAPTPARLLTTKTPSKNTPGQVNNSPSHRRVDSKPSQNPRVGPSPVKKEAVKDRIRAIESKVVSSPSHRKAASVQIAKKDVTASVAAAKPRHAAAKSVSSAGPIAPISSMSFSNSPAKQTTAVPNRRTTSGAPLVTSKPGFAPVKSSKPVTKSTFTLPGEAIAAKLKAQREERQKREEIEAEKKPLFKARPAPIKAAKPSIVPRENRASTVRSHARKASSEDKENVAPQRPSSMIVTSPKPLAAAQSKSSATASSSTTTAVSAGPRRTTIAPRPTSMIESRKTTSTKPAVKPTVSAQTSQRITSLTSGQPIAITKTEVAQQRIKGKEIYGKIRGTVQQLEEEKKAKEDAAKKARAEAAERGRQASREWAEKQKLKSMSAKSMAVNSESTAIAATAVGT